MNPEILEETSYKWKTELDKAKLILNTENIDTTQILAAHKLIPAHVNGMVPFGNNVIGFRFIIIN